MNREDESGRTDAGPADEEEQIGRDPPDRDSEVMCAYTNVDGVPGFVIAELDGDDAWLAVPDGIEIDATAWR